MDACKALLKQLGIANRYNLAAKHQHQHEHKAVILSSKHKYHLSFIKNKTNSEH